MNGERTTVMVQGDRQVVVMNSVAYASPEDAGQVIVTGSHGGRSAGEYARDHGVACVVCSDAGFGKNDAGIAGLREVDDDRIAGVAVAHSSARIGDGCDIWENGIITFVNETARRLGFAPGRRVQDQVRAYLRAERSTVAATGDGAAHRAGED